MLFVPSCLNLRGGGVIWTLWAGDSGCVIASDEGTNEDILGTWEPLRDDGREEGGTWERRQDTVHDVIYYGKGCGYIVVN